MVAEKVQELEDENAILKAQVEELQELCGRGAGFPKNCRHCRNFIQHYIRCGDMYCPVSEGHCVAGNRVKGRKAGQTCSSFARKEYGRNCWIFFISWQGNQSVNRKAPAWALLTPEV